MRSEGVGGVMALVFVIAVICGVDRGRSRREKRGKRNWSG